MCWWPLFGLTVPTSCADLLLWRFHGEYRGEAKLVEVKGPRDQLSEQQRAWLLFLMDCGFNTEVCKVSPLPMSAWGVILLCCNSGRKIWQEWVRGWSSQKPFNDYADSFPWKSSLMFVYVDNNAFFRLSPATSVGEDPTLQKFKKVKVLFWAKAVDIIVKDQRRERKP